MNAYRFRARISTVTLATAACLGAATLGWGALAPATAGATTHGETTSAGATPAAVEATTGQDDVAAGAPAEGTTGGTATPEPAGTTRAANSSRPSASAESQRQTAPKRNIPVPPEPAPPGPARTVYLTFDDGPSPYTPQVLDLLAQYHARATFFMVGQPAQAAPGMVARVRAAGHAIGNHTYSHPWLTGLSSSAVSDQITRTSGILGGTSCLRPPGGFVDGRVRGIAASLKQNVVMWSVDPNDWRRPGAGVIASRVLSQTREGSVVLMHDGGGDRSHSVAALRTILEKLSAQGYGFAALPQCA